MQRFVFFFLLTIVPSLAAIPSRTPVERALRCHDTHEIARWGAQWFHGVKAPALASKDFARRVAENLLELLDPQKVLFQKREAEGATEMVVKAWSAFIEGSNCSPIELWHSTIYPKVSARFQEDLLTIVKQLGNPFGKEWNPTWSTALNEWTDFTVSEAARRARVLSVSRVLWNHTSPEALSLFGSSLQWLTFRLNSLVLANAHLSVNELFTKAILNAFDDYTTYLSREEFQDFYEDLSPEMVGIGVEVRAVEGRGLLIEKVRENSPAAKSRVLKPGVLVTGINGTSLANVTDDVSKNLLKGPEDSELTLHYRNAQYKGWVRLRREHLSLAEEKVSAQVVKTSEGPVQVIRIPSFYGKSEWESHEGKSSADTVRDILEKMTASEPQAVLLDLRDNPGGYLEEAVEMASLFVGNKAIVGVSEGKHRRVLRGNRERPLYSGTLAVLINEETASAAEILAGALRDHGRAVLLGQTSFGKGSVQRLFELGRDVLARRTRPSGGVVKLTTSLFYCPSGSTPATERIRPDIALADAKEKASRSDRDLQPLMDSDERQQADENRRRLESLLPRLRFNHKALAVRSQSSLDTLHEAAEWTALYHQELEVPLVFPWSQMTALRQSNRAVIP